MMIPAIAGLTQRWWVNTVVNRFSPANINRSCQCLPAVLLGVNALLLMWGAYVHSPTLNEPGHLVAGISYWQFGRFDIYNVNPPLVRMIAAAPVLLANPKTDWDGFCESSERPEFLLGERFVAANGDRSTWLFTLARWACIPFSLLGGCVCYWWGKQLYGEAAGLISLALWCLCPNLLGHGQLVTPDMAATALALAACYSFWLWLKRPTWMRALASGIVLGIAELTKTTLVVLFPLWFLIWLVYRWQDRHALRLCSWLREVGMLAARMIIALYVLNLGYGFEGSFTRLGDFKFMSASLGAEAGALESPVGGGNRFADVWIGRLPVPLPRHYLLGMDLQRRDFENYHYPSYLSGQFSPKGWWYYYLYAMAIKVPLGTWLLFLLAASCRFWRRPGASIHSSCESARGIPTATHALKHVFKPSWRDEFVLLSPAVAVLTLVSSQTGFSEHMRYVLPAFPYCFIWIGRIAPFLGGQRRVPTGIAVAAILWSSGSSLAVYPHSLSYFNEMVGGPLGGPRHLIQSNIDWGQDLLFLKRWLDEHPSVRPLKLAYFGYCDPRYVGIEYSAPKLPVPTGSEAAQHAIPPGWYAISVNFVRGLPYFAYAGDGTKTSYAQDSLSAFQRIEPTAMAGYSIYIYHIE